MPLFRLFVYVALINIYGIVYFIDILFIEEVLVSFDLKLLETTLQIVIHNSNLEYINYISK